MPPERCRRAFEVDLVAFVHDASGPTWADFREHYPLCADCSVEVRTWTELEIVLQGGAPPATTHPTPDDLLRLEDGDGLDADYRRIVEYHIASCRPCADEIATLRAFDFNALEARATPPVAEAQEPELDVEPTSALEPQLDAEPTRAPEPELDVEPTSALEPQFEADSASEFEPGLDAEPTSAPEPQLDAESTSALEPQFEADSASEFEPGLDAEPTSAPEPGLDAEPTSAPEPQLDAESTSAPEPQLDVEPISAPEPQPHEEPLSGLEPQPREEPLSEPEPQPHEETTAEPTIAAPAALQGAEAAHVPGDRGFLPPEALLEGFEAVDDETRIGPSVAARGRLAQIARHPAVGVLLVAVMLLPVLWVGELPRFPFGAPARPVAHVPDEPYQLPEARLAVATVMEPGDGLTAEERALEMPSSLPELEAAAASEAKEPTQVALVRGDDTLSDAPGVIVPEEAEAPDDAADPWALARLDDGGPIEIVGESLAAGLELEVPVPLTVPAGAVLQVQISGADAREIVERLSFPGAREVAVRVPAGWLVPGTYEVRVGVVRRGPAPVRVASYALVVH